MGLSPKGLVVSCWHHSWHGDMLVDTNIVCSSDTQSGLWQPWGVGVPEILSSRQNPKSFHNSAERCSYTLLTLVPMVQEK